MDRPDDPAYVGCFFLNANASPEHPPLVVDADRNAIMDRGEVYSGCYGRGCVSFFPYNTQGNKGIGCGLIGVQKLQDGEPLGSVVTAESAFGDADDDEDFLE